LNKIFLLFFFLFFIKFLSAQTEEDSLDYITVTPQANILSTRLNKQLNTYNLNSHLFLSQSVSNMSLKLSENFNSAFIKSTEKSIRDEQLLKLSASYNLNQNINIGAALNSSILSDSRKIEINQASISDVSIFTQVKPDSSILIAPYYGYMNNRQIGEIDNGYTYGVEGIVNNIDLSDMMLFSEAKFRNEDISPRKNTLRYFDVGLKNFFNPSVSNSITAYYYQNRKDFYYTADSVTSRQFDIVDNIQSRIETGYYFEDKLQHTNFLNMFNLNLRGAVNWRNIDRDTRYIPLQVNSSAYFDTKINQLKIALESDAGYTSGIFNGIVRLNYSEQDEKHITKDLPGVNPIFFDERSQLENSKNNNAVRISAAFLGGLNFSNKDNITFSFLQNKLRYDTPSQDNYDDRDELLSIIRLRYTHQLTPFFQMFANIEGTVSHTVYIYSEKSSNNNINRVLSFESGGLYSGKNFTSLNTFEVSANYTVYDFEDINPTFKSFSFRQYTANDSTVLRITKRLSIAEIGYIKLSEQGDLKWKDFASKPTRFLQEIYSEPKFIVNFLGTQFALGIRLFSLNTYKYNEEVRIVDSKYFSIGPLTEIYLLAADQLFLKFRGWYEFITISNSPRKELANLNMEINWRF